jgi:hypothetical protein
MGISTFMHTRAHHLWRNNNDHNVSVRRVDY